METPFTPIRFRDEDHALLDVDQLSLHARVSRAFIRICVDQGCPTMGGRLSQAMLMGWLFENYEAVRNTAGMPAMAPVEGLAPAMASKLKMGNSLLTLLEYSCARTSKEGEKRRIQNVYRMVASALDRR